jgi:hypothetical protein
MTDSPLRILGTGSRAWANTTVALAALEQASGGRKDALLVVGDCPTGGDVYLKAAAFRLGWPRPLVKRANWTAPCDASCRPGHRRRRMDGTSYCPLAGMRRNTEIVASGATAGVALLATGLRNRGTLDCAAKALAAGIEMTAWCDECPPAPLPAPCQEHSIPEVVARWALALEKTRQPAGLW